MAFDEDLSEFFDPDEFADTATFTPAGGSPSAVNGIYDGSYVEPFADVEGNAPRFTCPTASIPDVQDGDALAVRGISFKVAGVQPSGQGKTVLVLKAL